jgi:hypothetical protein
VSLNLSLMREPPWRGVKNVEEGALRRGETVPLDFVGNLMRIRSLLGAALSCSDGSVPTSVSSLGLLGLVADSAERECLGKGPGDLEERAPGGETVSLDSLFLLWIPWCGIMAVSLTLRLNGFDGDSVELERRANVARKSLPFELMLPLQGLDFVGILMRIRGLLGATLRCSNGSMPTGFSSLGLLGLVADSAERE